MGGAKSEQFGFGYTHRGSLTSCGDKHTEPGIRSSQVGGLIPPDADPRQSHQHVSERLRRGLAHTAQQPGTEPGAFPQCTGGPVSPVGDAHVPTRPVSSSEPVFIHIQSSERLFVLPNACDAAATAVDAPRPTSSSDGLN